MEVICSDRCATAVSCPWMGGASKLLTASGNVEHKPALPLGGIGEYNVLE